VLSRTLDGDVMRRSIATVSLSGTLEEKLAVAAQIGFDGVEIFEADLVACASTPRQVRERAHDLGLRLELYQPLRDFEAVPPELSARNLRRARLKFGLMGELGIETILVCSSVSPSAVDDDSLAAEQLLRLAELAAEHGIRVAYEALAWGRYVNDYAHSWKIVAAADHPNLGVCLDSFHILSRGHDPSGIREVPGEKIFFLQLADAPEMRLDVLQWSRHYRCFPGQGGFDLSGFVEHVLAAGYTGPLSLEVFNDVFRQADPERTATDALRSLIVLEESLGVRMEATARVRERIELAALPAPVDPSGFAFVEIAVDPLAEMAAEHLLRGLGFARVGRHRSKPVQMWQQRDARILLNRSRPAPDDWSRGEAAVAAIAVETDDSTRAARRAEALLAPPIPRRYGPGEADLVAIAAPDGTSVFFCRTDPPTRTPASSWLGDFASTSDHDPGEAGVLTHIDHVGLSQPPYYFDEAALFYQSVLGLRRTDSVEIPDPYGLVRSRAVTSAGGRLRLVLNVPALGGGRLPETAEFQHVALACPDIFAAAVDMRVRRVPTLPIPDNYYDDLAARLDLDESLVDTMRAYGVLYDRDEGGEFFHFYTAMLGRRMFFEIVQRAGSYDGFGVPNTPTRMAAQFRHIALAGIMY
jgi:4-hydroxyphenylpyruvate dioxygenase